ncbi:hypothetical protein CHH27_21295 [Labrenzia sp. VG12]|nr:hypothetical protein CHH27_21295 [Labrenzia sp. VG12]
MNEFKEGVPTQQGTVRCLEKGVAMPALLTNWKNFCEGTAEFDKSHFLALFHQDYDEEALAQLLRFFDRSDQLIKRISRFRAAWHRRRKRETLLSEIEACALAMKDLVEKSVAFEAFGERDLMALTNRVTPIVTGSVADFEQAAQADWPNREKQVVLGDYFDEKWSVHGPIMDALLEAFYGAANSYDLQWYLGAPLMDTTVDFEHFLRLWEAGYDTALTEVHLLLIRVSD